MRYLLDTSTCIMHLTGRSAAVTQQILVHPDEQIVTCAVVKAELFAAAIALSNDLILVTHNTREFSRIPDLSIEDWERH